MALVTGFTAARMLEIENSTVVDGEVNVDGDLILLQRDGTAINAGQVKGSDGADATPMFEVVDNASVRFELDGAGTAPDPWVLEAFALAPELQALASAANMDSLFDSGTYIVTATATANTLKNWPVEAIPRADKADANNAAGAFRAAPVGTIRVVNTGTNIYQYADVRVSGGGSSGYYPSMVAPFSYQRMFDVATSTWWPWVFVGPIVGVRSQAERDLISVRSFHAPISKRTRTPMKVIFSGSGTASPQAPFEQCTIDGVQWFGLGGTTSGRATSGWTSLTWGSGITNYGSGWPSPTAIRTSEGIIVVRGLGQKTPVLTNGDIIFNLPEGMRPAGRLLFGGPSTNNSGLALLRVLENGDVTFLSTASGATTFLDVSCIMFPAADVAPNSAWTAVTLSSGWTNYTSGGYPAASWWQDAFGRVWLRGMLTGTSIPSADSQMFQLPEGLAPQMQAHALAPSLVNNGGVSVHWVANTPAAPTTTKMNYVYKVGNPTGSVGWVSLAQSYIFPALTIPDSYWRNIAFANGWSAYNVGSTYPVPGVWTAPDGITHVRGLAKGGTAPPVVVTAAMGVGDRPVYNLMTSVTSNNANSRASMNGGAADYAITANTGVASWYTFDGIHYFTEG